MWQGKRDNCLVPCAREKSKYTSRLERYDYEHPNCSSSGRSFTTAAHPFTAPRASAPLFYFDAGLSARYRRAGVSRWGRNLCFRVMAEQSCTTRSLTTVDPTAHADPGSRGKAATKSQLVDSAAVCPGVCPTLAHLHFTWNRS